MKKRHAMTHDGSGAAVERHPVDRLSVFVAGGLLSGLAAVMYEISSQFTHMLGKTYGFSEGNQGDFTAAFFIGNALIGLAMAFWIRKANWRHLVRWASVIGAALFLVLLLVHSYVAILFVMFASGLALGANYVLSVTLFCDSSSPDRAVGFKLFCDVVPGMALNFLLPHIYVLGGFDYVAMAMAICCGISALCANWIPARTGRRIEANGNPFRASNAGLSFFACFICLVYSIATMSLWAFLGQLGDLKGVPPGQLGTLLGLASLLNGVGSLAGTALGDRYGRLRPVAVTLSISLGSLALIGLGRGPTAFVVATLMFSSVNNLTSLYFLSSAASVDKTGQFMAVASAAFSGGAIIGPPIGGRLLEQLGLQAMVIMPAVIWTVSFGLFILFHVLVRKGDRKASLSEPHGAPDLLLRVSNQVSGQMRS